MTQFKVGDRAVIASNKWDGKYPGTSPFRKGAVVKVVKPAMTKYFDWYVQAVDGTTSFLPVRESELQYAPAQSFTLRRGDHIVNTETGRKGHVVEGQYEELWVVDDSYLEETGAPAKAVEEYEHHYPGTYELTNRKETEGPF